MPNNGRHPSYLQFATTCLASAFIAVAVTPSIADEQFAVTTIVQLPDAQILSAFDISFVDPKSHTYALAASRVVGSGGPFGTVIIVNTQKNVVTKELQATPPFVGDCSVPPARDTISGPNGVIVIEKGAHTDVWAADGPVSNPRCTTLSPSATTGLLSPSTVKVIDLKTGATKAVIPTGTGLGTKTPGIRRADELCFNPESDVVLVANDDPVDNFITFIGEDSFKVLQRIRFDGTDPNGHNILANGIEQCQFNPRDEKFYLAIPATGTDAKPGPGIVVRISGEAPFRVEKAFTIATATGCVGPQGLTIGPDHQIGLGCGGTNSLIIDDRDGSTIKIVTGEGGTDEAWFNPGDNHYFFARSTPAKLGVEDAGPPPSADPDAVTAVGSHSVAADPKKNQVYVPIRGNNGTTPPSTTGKICGSATDVHGLKGSDALGCIAVYTAPRDKDDRRAEDEDDR
ncbi:MAG TPA: hypothetical protein VKP67_09380 [Xanthobacteraceae bacterium]|nr:hypothetical protein [Xanthobacteraceae bacterium]